ncbi:hypothetical protein H4696_005949 [Amycolatopsis lexingtonensis]|uniref:Uncharacterized protein n=1 Tax=Amycolatopsis lexingtonensis TaxID=218822 RepID=A0ABR9I6Q1_9PSEU|nr:hypothetical protein [Amycolatopsis lexingtonensis]MBE1498849.1 hypothetical protein [Amycolatopsis lexingtonensis]
MDEDYARRLRDWLRAEPETAEPRWLREIPAPDETRDHHPADRWQVQGHLPHTEAAPDDDAGLAVVIPLPRPSRENGCRLSGPRTRPMSEAEARSRRNHPSNAGRREEAAEPPMSEAEARSRWNHPSNAGRRAEDANSPMGEAEARNRWNHASSVGREEAAEPQTPPSPMSEAEARSRWNHPANWHRRRRAAENPQRDEPGSR